MADDIERLAGFEALIQIGARPRNAYSRDEASCVVREWWPMIFVLFLAALVGGGLTVVMAWPLGPLPAVMLASVVASCVAFAAAMIAARLANRPGDEPRTGLRSALNRILPR